MHNAAFLLRHGSHMLEKLGFDGETLGAPRAQTCAKEMISLDPLLRIALGAL